ncbi:MAG: hypothetical protein MSH49_01505, partial [[Eubacterium] saphenum]|nr:hypothetical protein [[Eubacterium] saphenum]
PSVCKFYQQDFTNISREKLCVFIKTCYYINVISKRISLLQEMPTTLFINYQPSVAAPGKKFLGAAMLL